ncbi:MAG: hypothetical protein AAF715_31995 [Myxococcota bacterium]
MTMKTAAVKSRALVATLAALSLGVEARIASSQTPTPAPTVDLPADPELVEDAARELYRRAREARRDGDHASCYRDMLAAWKLSSKPNIALGLGDCALSVGRNALAATRLSWALENATDAMRAQPGTIDHFRKRLEQAKSAVATVEVTVVPAGEDVELSVDGTSVEDPSAPLFLAPSTPHRIEARRPGFAPASTTVNLPPGQEKALELQLQPLGDAGAGGGAMGGGGASGAGQGDDDGDGIHAAWPIGLGVAGVALLGVGAGMFVVGQGQRDDAEALEAQNGCAQSLCPEVADAYADADASRDASTGLFIAGGALSAAAVGALIWWWATHDDEPTAEPQDDFIVSPLVTPRAAGVRLDLAF